MRVDVTPVEDVIKGIPFVGVWGYCPKTQDRKGGMTVTHAGPGWPPGIRQGPDGLTGRQRNIVDCIARSVADRGYPPSMRGIGQAVCLTSTSSVVHQLLALERKGALRRDPACPRLLPPPQVVRGRRV